jgi:hypothetical protein
MWLIKRAVQVSQVFGDLSNIKTFEDFSRSDFAEIVLMDPTTKVRIGAEDKHPESLQELWEALTAVHPKRPDERVFVAKRARGIDGVIIGSLARAKQFLGEKWADYKDAIQQQIKMMSRGKLESVGKSMKSIDSFEHALGLFGLSAEPHVEDTSPKKSVPEILAQKNVSGINYVLYKALSPEQITFLARKGPNRWCVNSFSYALSYFNQGPFYFIFADNIPIFGIGGSDGISDIANDSLTLHSNIKILKEDMDILIEWEPIYTPYRLNKNQKVVDLNEVKQNIIDVVPKNTRGLSFDEIVMMLRMPDIFSIHPTEGKITYDDVLKNLLKFKRPERRHDGESIDSAEKLYFFAKIVLNEPFEKTKKITDKEAIEKATDIIAEDTDMTIEYLTNVYKYIPSDEKVRGKYLEGLFESLLNQDDDLDGDTAGQVIALIDLFERTNLKEKTEDTATPQTSETTKSSWLSNKSISVWLRS